MPRAKRSTPAPPSASRPNPTLSVAGLMSFYSRRRRWIYGAVTLLAIGFSSLLAALHRDAPVDYGYWLRQLFIMRGGATGDLGVEIVAFDKTFDPQSYSKEDLDKSPGLKLLAETRGLRFSRGIQAAVLDRLVAAGARQVVFDFVFEGPGPDEAGDKAFAESLKRNRDKAVIGFAYSASQNARGDGLGMAEWIVSVNDPNDAFLADENPERALGFVNTWPESNNFVARMVGREDKLSLAKPSMAAKMTTFEDMSLSARAASRCGASVPGDNASRLIGFAGPGGTFRATSVDRLFTPESASLLPRFKGKIVVVGPYSEIHYKGDWFPTPVGFMAGAEIQANCVRNWIGSSWIREPFAGRYAFVPALAACLLTLLAGLLFSGLQSGVRVLLLVSVPVAYLAVSYALFSGGGIFTPLVPAMVAAMLGLSFGAMDFIHAQYERRRIKGLFGSYLAPVVVDRLISSGAQPELGGEQVLLTAFFTDIRRFSTFAEKLAPGELVALMNEYLGAMTGLLEEESGTLDKYVGDGIVAMFGAPVALHDHAYRACVCALRMQATLSGMRAGWTSRGGFLAMAGRDLRMRIGLNTGMAVVGNMGSAKRFNYTMMGDSVNLASRCEAEARDWGVFTIATEDTVAATRAAGGREILFRRLGRQRVKGRNEPVDLFEVVGYADEATPGRLECIRLYGVALDAFLAKDFPLSARLFAESEACEPHMPAFEGSGEESPSRVMHRHCESDRPDKDTDFSPSGG